jgi:hypothetical protein
MTGFCVNVIVESPVTEFPYQNAKGCFEGVNNPVERLAEVAKEVPFHSLAKRSLDVLLAIHIILLLDGFE